MVLGGHPRDAPPRPTAGYLYQAVLRRQLTRTLGVEWAPVRRGQAEITGIPTDVRACSPPGGGQIRDQLDTTGASGGQAAQVACLTTSPPKTPRALWRGVWCTRRAS